MVAVMDASGNRVRYDVATGAPAACPASTPTPTPTPAPSFAIANAATVTEGGTLVYTVTKTGTTASTFTVNFATANGSATAGSDYNTVSGALTFAPLDISKTVNVTTIDDASVESPETALVNLFAVSGGAAITTAQGSGTINDNDAAPPPSFAISSAPAVTEGGTLAYTVTKTGTTASTFTVNFATANGTAAAGSDYTATSGTLTFPPTTPSMVINVATINDTSVESAETVLVNLSAASGGAAITTAQGSGTINDNDTGNQPPVPGADATSFSCNLGSTTINLVSNDTDPENNVPLALVSIDSMDASGNLSATTISSTTASIAGNVPGSYSLSYIVADSLGATATGYVTVQVTGNSFQCGG
jgi:hypothetical protein